MRLSPIFRITTWPVSMASIAMVEPVSELCLRWILSDVRCSRPHSALMEGMPPFLVASDSASATMQEASSPASPPPMPSHTAYSCAPVPSQVNTPPASICLSGMYLPFRKKLSSLFLRTLPMWLQTAACTLLLLLIVSPLLSRGEWCAHLRGPCHGCCEWI